MILSFIINCIFGIISFLSVIFEFVFSMKGLMLFFLFAIIGFISKTKEEALTKTSQDNNHDQHNTSISSFYERSSDPVSCFHCKVCKKSLLHIEGLMWRCEDCGINKIIDYDTD